MFCPLVAGLNFEVYQFYIFEPVYFRVFDDGNV